jgi:hypothetical protein
MPSFWQLRKTWQLLQGFHPHSLHRMHTYAPPIPILSPASSFIHRLFACLSGIQVTCIFPHLAPFVPNSPTTRATSLLRGGLAFSPGAQ